jgi:DNA-binding MarR family transcriptional regulator
VEILEPAAPDDMAAYGSGVALPQPVSRPEPPPLPALLARTGTALGRFRNAVTAGDGLTTTALGALGVLAHTDGLSHRELAAELGVTPATVTPVVDGLEREGSVRRERDPADRRIVRLRITAPGRRRLAAAQERAEAVYRDRLPRPSAEEEAVVRRYLLAVLDAVDTDGA